LEGSDNKKVYRFDRPKRVSVNQIANGQDGQRDETAQSKAVNRQFSSDDPAPYSGLIDIGDPEGIATNLSKVGYQCLNFVAVQLSLVLNTKVDRVRALLLEGPSGCGKSFLAKSLSKITGAELMCLSCYAGMPLQNLIEVPSTLGMAKALASSTETKAEDIMSLGLLTRAFIKSQEKPVILLIDELDKADGAIDTFFLGPLQDSRIWLESRAPVDANSNNLLIIFTKNFNRQLDDALLRRVHPITMTYLDSTLERKVLSGQCHPLLVRNLVSLAERMRQSNGSYTFDRPPAPEELLTAGHYIQHLLKWNINDYTFVGKSVWNILSKSPRDRAVLEHMMRFHPDFIDPLIDDAKTAPIDVIYKKLGRLLLDGLVQDPEALERERALREQEFEQ